MAVLQGVRGVLPAGMSYIADTENFVDPPGAVDQRKFFWVDSPGAIDE